VIAAVYAHKSTDQNADADEAKSVTRQIAHATAYATRKGWTVPETCIFVDDGFSGAEFARRPGVQRLRAALEPRPSFQVLVVSEQSRLSRDTADTLQVQGLARAGVRVFAYQDDRPISLDTPADTLFTTVKAWKDSEATRESSVRVHDALGRKAVWYTSPAGCSATGTVTCSTGPTPMGGQGDRTSDARFRKRKLPSCIRSSSCARPASA
jgi:DNA invertase Pin-like site-specific DNA recombinase